jgi:hypothetical protein
VGRKRKEGTDESVVVDVLVKERASVYAMLWLTSCDLRTVYYYF